MNPNLLGIIIFPIFLIGQLFAADTLNTTIDSVACSPNIKFNQIVHLTGSIAEPSEFYSWLNRKPNPELQDQVYSISSWGLPSEACPGKDLFSVLIIKGSKVAVAACTNDSSFQYYYDHKINKWRCKPYAIGSLCNIVGIVRERDLPVNALDDFCTNKHWLFLEIWSITSMK